MQIVTKTDGKLHYVSDGSDFYELLFAYLGPDAADGFRIYCLEAQEAADAKKDSENLDELCGYVLQRLLPGIAREVKRFRNHPDMDERLEKWAADFNGKVEDIYGNFQ